MNKDVKKRSIACLLIVLLFAVLSFGVNQTGASAVFYNKTTRALPIYEVDRDDKKISISFDCAWGVEYTDEILEILNKYNVKCTFFAVKFWVDKYPDYVKKIVEMGHEMGTHSATHSYMSKQSESTIRQEISSSCGAIEAITGNKVKLFRPPYGDYNDLLVNTVNSMGLMTIQWNADSLDWKNLSAQKIAERVLKKVKSGSIILCHNNGLHTAESLPLIFGALQSAGYTFVPIGELVYSENYYIDSLGIQHKKN